jgi:hypothetical protein
VKTTQTGLVSVADQRGVCSATGTFWDLRLSTGNVRFETYDGKTLLDVASTGTLVNDGRSHHLLVERRTGTVTIHIDGTAAVASPMATSFGALPALQSGTDVCDGHSMQVAFMGTLTGLCVSSP